VPALDLHSMLLQASELAATKSASLEAACRRVADAERALAALRAEQEVLAGSARSVDELVVALQQQIQRSPGAGSQTQAGVAEEPGGGDPPSARAAVRRAVRELLLEREEATTKEITQHIQRVLPNVNTKNTSPELSRLVQQGLLVRPSAGVYRLGGEWAVAERR
jgi:hypothetical protein